MARPKEKVVGALLDTFFPRLLPADRKKSEEKAENQLYIDYYAFQATDVDGTVLKAGFAPSQGVPLRDSQAWCQLSHLQSAFRIVPR